MPNGSLGHVGSILVFGTAGQTNQEVTDHLEVDGVHSYVLVLAETDILVPVDLILPLGRGADQDIIQHFPGSVRPGSRRFRISGLLRGGLQTEAEVEVGAEVDEEVVAGTHTENNSTEQGRIRALGGSSTRGVSTTSSTTSANTGCNLTEQA